MTERLSVLIICINYAPEVTGVARYSTEIARGLADRGHRVQVVTGFPHYPAWRTAPGYERGWWRRERDGGIEVLRVRHPVPRNSVGVGRVIMEAAFTAQVFAAQCLVGGARDPDVILVLSPALLSTAAALARRRGRRTAVGVVVQDLYSRAFPETGALNGHGGRHVIRLERELLSRADGVSVLHDKFRDTAVALGVPREQIVVIRNWAHISPPTADRETTRAALGWAPDETVVLHAGNMGYKQGLENVVEAARLADAEQVPVRFVLLGDGARREALEEAGRDVARLDFLAPLPDNGFENALAAADVLLLNEKPEVSDMSVPGKLTSYFAAGRPVVAVTDPRSGAAAEVTASGAGVRVTSGEPASLLKGVLALREDPERCAELGRSGQEYADAVLTADAALGAYERWVLSLARKARGDERRALAQHPAEPR
jgi:colanic acid biosynthesis glycosyl transferase WcaI